MAWHTLREAVKLTGRSRRSLYRDIESGRVSSELGRDGQRRFETSELIRAYGPLAPVAHPPARKVAEAGTPLTVPSDMAELAKELRELKEEVKELKQALMRLEYLPEPPATAPALSEAPPVPLAVAPASKPRSFADLLSQLD